MITQILQRARGRLIGGAAVGLLSVAPCLGANDALQRLADYLDEVDRSAWATDEVATAAIEQRLRVRLVAALRAGGTAAEGSYPRLWEAYDRAVRGQINHAEAEATLALSALQDAEKLLPQNPTPEQTAYVEAFQEARRRETARELALARERVWVADRLRTLRGRTDVHLDLWARCLDRRAHEALQADFDAFVEREGSALAAAFRDNERFPGLIARIFSPESHMSGGAAARQREHLARRLASLGPLGDLGVPADLEQAIRTARARELLEDLERLSAVEAPGDRAECLSTILQSDLVARAQDSNETTALLVQHGLRRLDLELADWTQLTELPGSTVSAIRITGAELWSEDLDGGVIPHAVTLSEPVRSDWWLLEGQRYRLSIETKLQRGGAESTRTWQLLVKVDTGPERARTISFPRFIPDGTRPIADAIQPNQPSILLTGRLSEHDFMTGFSHRLERQLSFRVSPREPVDALLSTLREVGSPDLRESLVAIQPGASLEDLRSALRSTLNVASSSPCSLPPSPRYASLLGSILDLAPAGPLEAQHLTVLDNDDGQHLEADRAGDPYDLQAEGQLWFESRRYEEAEGRPLLFRLVVR